MQQSLDKIFATSAYSQECREAMESLSLEETLRKDENGSLLLMCAILGLNNRTSRKMSHDEHVRWAISHKNGVKIKEVKNEEVPSVHV